MHNRIRMRLGSPLINSMAWSYPIVSVLISSHCNTCCNNRFGTGIPYQLSFDALTCLKRGLQNGLFLQQMHTSLRDKSSSVGSSPQQNFPALFPMIMCRKIPNSLSPYCVLCMFLIFLFGIWTAGVLNVWGAALDWCWLCNLLSPLPPTMYQASLLSSGVILNETI